MNRKHEWGMTVSPTPVHRVSRAMTAALMALAAATPPVAAGAEQAGAGTTVPCSSAAGERRHCPADTSAGVLLLRVTGDAPCLLGRHWGYDDAGVWVMDGCSGEFLVRAAAEAVPQPGSTEPPPEETPTEPTPTEPAPAEEPQPPAGSPYTPEAEPIETWGAYDPGEGFLVGRGRYGELSISGYAMLRYMNQNDSDGVFVDHFGNERAVDPRHDFFSHRIIAYLMGWAGNPKLRYTIFFWTVNTTDQDAIFANLGYQFHRKLSLYGGIAGNPGSRSLQGSHPYWLGHDRVMADEFFRPYFTFGVWATGEVAPGLWYTGMIGNNSSALGITAAQLDRRFTRGLSMWWMPTTHEFGPRGGYGDWEWHEEAATRFGFSYTESPEQRQPDPSTGFADNTTIRLADSLNLFDPGSLAPGVTVNEVDYRVLALDAGFKYRGVFVQAEYYRRELDGFVADGPLPVDQIVDDGFYVQAAFFPVKQRLELYGVTSQIFGDSGAGFDDSSEYGLGMNFYPWEHTRGHRINVQVLDVDNSPVSSTFGYYTGGQDGITAATSFSLLF